MYIRRAIGAILLTFTMVSVQAGNSQKNPKKHTPNPKSVAAISFTIAPDSCLVTINSSKDISNIVIKDEQGSILKKWDDLDGQQFDDFGMYAALLPSSLLHVKSGNNGKRGVGAEIGQEFRDELNSCLQPSCSFTPQIDNILATGMAEILDQSFQCTVAAGAEILGVVDGRGEFGLFPELADELALLQVQDFRGPDECISIGALPLPEQTRYTPCSTGVINGRVEPDEARACATYIGCSNFNIPD